MNSVSSPAGKTGVSVHLRFGICCTPKDDMMAAGWDRVYSREVAAFPTRTQRTWKDWPSVNRVDNVFGDRNFVCSCPPIAEYADY